MKYHTENKGEVMGILVDIFGNTPRVRTLEALIRLSPLEFTEEELAEEASPTGPWAEFTVSELEEETEVEMPRASTYRSIEDLVEEDLLGVVSDGRPRTYRVNHQSRLIQRLSQIEAVLELDEMDSDLAPADLSTIPHHDVPDREEGDTSGHHSGMVPVHG